MRCAICGLDPCATLGFCESCRRADAKRKTKAESALPKYWESMDVGALWDELNDRRRFPEAPNATYDALVWSLIYNRHPTAAVRAGNRHRLAQLSQQQLQDLIAALKRNNCDPALIAEIESNL
jgi:hypothetical protein